MNSQNVCMFLWKKKKKKKKGGGGGGGVEGGGVCYIAFILTAVGRYLHRGLLSSTFCKHINEQAKITFD